MREFAPVILTALAAPAWLVLFFAHGPLAFRARVISVVVLVLAVALAAFVYRRPAE